jgi:SET domain-containing protein
VAEGSGAGASHTSRATGSGARRETRSRPARRRERIEGASIALADAGEKGRGVFALRPFRTGELIERVPVLVLPAADWEHLRETRLMEYAFCWGKRREQAAVALGFGSFYNHGDPANAETIERPEEDAIDFLALRDIDAGEEITIDYTGADKSREVWFDVTR